MWRCLLERVSKIIFSELTLNWRITSSLWLGPNQALKLYQTQIYQLLYCKKDALVIKCSKRHNNDYKAGKVRTQTEDMHWGRTLWTRIEYQHWEQNCGVHFSLLWIDFLICLEKNVPSPISFGIEIHK